MSANRLIAPGDPAPDATLPNERGESVTLSSVWSRQPIVLVFVRHSGCTLCRGQADELRNAYPEIQAAGGEVVLVTMNDPERLKAFKQLMELPYLCLGDPEQAAYRAYQCPRGNLMAVGGPAIWGRAIVSLIRHGFGQPRGDLMQLPGSFVIDQSGVVRFAHHSRHSADWASAEQLIAALKELAPATAKP